MGPARSNSAITANPVSRWEQLPYAYKKDTVQRWHGMVVLHVAESSFSCGLIESHLIRLFRTVPGCRNTRPGGETLSSQPGPHCVYVVYRTLGLNIIRVDMSWFASRAVLPTCL